MSALASIRASEEALAFHEALRRLGFRADDIFVGGGQQGGAGGPLTFFVRLRMRGMPEVNLACGTLTEIELRALEAEWPRIARAWNETMSAEEREAIYAKSFVRVHAAALVMMLIAKGHSLSPDADSRVVATWWNA